jgi:hypothetical protein
MGPTFAPIVADPINKENSGQNDEAPAGIERAK